MKAYLKIPEKIFHFLVDGFHKITPRPTATKDKLLHCKIISHRGEHDNKKILENTMIAFDEVLAAKVWGIEFDIRWTSDLIPIVFHDSDLWRLFHDKAKVSEVSFKDLKTKYPLIPSLADVVEQYGGKLHLMIELKKEIYPQPEQQMQTLKNILAKLTPIEDFHFISIHPEVFDYATFLPTQALLPIALTSYKNKSHLSFKKDYGGILGHYQFLSRYRINRHLFENHKIGVGFIASKNSLFRELNRGVEWIFSNDAVYLQRIVDEELKR